MARRRKLTKKQRETRNKWILRLVSVLLAFLIGLSFGKGGEGTNFSETFSNWREQLLSVAKRGERPFSLKKTGPQEAAVRFLDVGQGSATLLQSEDGTNILVDTGRYDDGEKRILQYLDQHIGTGGQINLLIFTHNDADHIGYGELILQYYDVEEVWMNGVDTTTQTYERVLDAILDSDAEYTEPRAGDVKELGGFYIEVLHPDPETMTQDTNEESLVTRIKINGVSVMISGDASSDVENKIVENGMGVESEVMVMGHHGSTYSSGGDWIEQVNPKLAVYSAGANNPYEHPHVETLERFRNRGIPVYGTSAHGTITLRIKENGSYSIELEREGDTHARSA
ncbi:ComEC/Rec2 family competence protein [Atopococcus tabaci]|uniref:ComEC/Rec2 family competence protein n=1 Tax=Atopococcus tabaci TaxID=269774 RepID=UPI0003F94DBC|nr:ComEC/Rec2 family competence protein [Atopococcus tabaci]